MDQNEECRCEHEICGVVLKVPVKVEILPECDCDGDVAAGGSVKQPDYSLEEQDTGRRWLDGKKIYQRTIACGVLPNTTTKTVAHGIANIEHVVRFYGTSNNGNIFVAMPHVGGTDIYTHVDKTNISIVTKGDCTTYSGTHVTVFYTCTDR